MVFRQSMFYLSFLVIVFSLNRGSHRKCSAKKDAIKSFANFTGKYLCLSLFLIKLHTFSAGTLLKRDSNIGGFLWNLPNSEEQLLWRTSANNCFYLKLVVLFLFVAFIMKKITFYNVVHISYQMKHYHFFIVKIIFESMNLMHI